MGTQGTTSEIAHEAGGEATGARVYKVDLLEKVDAAGRHIPYSEHAVEKTQRDLPWEATYRGPLNLKFLALRGKYKDIFDALGGGDAFMAELRHDPEEPRS